MVRAKVFLANKRVFTIVMFSPTRGVFTIVMLSPTRRLDGSGVLQYRGDGDGVLFKMRSDGCGVCSPRKGVVVVVFFQKEQSCRSSFSKTTSE